jgi:uracil-DNA glycosylase family 4
MGFIMEGFFSINDVQTTQNVRRISGCGACGLHLHCTSPKQEAIGRGEKGILIIGESPTVDEDQNGTTFTSTANQLLRRKLRWQGIDLERDCRRINAVCCLTKDDKQPTSEEIECCRPRIWKEIDTFKPHLIILLGIGAVQTFLGHRWKHKIGTITLWRGWSIPDRDTNAWVVPMFDMDYVLDSQGKKGNPAVEQIFNDDLVKARKLIDVPVYHPAIKETASIKIIKDQSELCQVLSNIMEWYDLAAFDYETTGLKPQAEGHRIVTASICACNELAYSFDFPNEGTKAYALFKRFLMSEKIKKIASNMRMEDHWSNVILGTPVKGWAWDTMLAAHVLDNREDITGLKFQSYARFGVLDYSSHIEPYLKAKKEDGGNGFNRIDEAPHNDLLLYGGIDSLLEFRLAKLQMGELNYALKN